MCNCFKIKFVAFWKENWKKWLLYYIFVENDKSIAKEYIIWKHILKFSNFSRIYDLNEILNW